MGESKRRKQILGENYGIPNVKQQVDTAWKNIERAIQMATEEQQECLLIQCCNNNRGFCYDAISTMKEQLNGWRCELEIPILIQMLPQGFTPSATKLFDGFITVWCNSPTYKLWETLFQTPVSQKN